MKQRNLIGLDLAKSIFHYQMINQRGKALGRQKLRRADVATHFANLELCIVAMEACAGAHYWAQLLQAQGHEVRLLPAQHVKPYRRGNKNDYNDALAIAEAALRPEIRHVRVKSPQQLQLQALGRMRELAVKQRSDLVKQIQGLLSEFGIIIPKSVTKMRKHLPLILEDADNGLSINFRHSLNQCYERLQYLSDQIAYFDKQQQTQTSNDEDCKLLKTVPGLGPVSVIEFTNHVADPSRFKRGRDVSASIGIVPGQNTTGGKAVLTGISKRGNKRLRYLLIHGARSVARNAANKNDPLSLWFCQLQARRGYNKAVVALANKIARIGWAVLVTRKPYQAGYRYPKPESAGATI